MEACKVEDLMPTDMAAEMKKSKTQRAIEWGRPGHLTKEEVDVFVSVSFPNGYNTHSTTSYCLLIIYAVFRLNRSNSVMK